MSNHDHDHEHEHEHDEDAERAAESEVRKRIALSQVRQYGDLVLRMRASEVVEFDEELAQLVERMTGLMHDAHGVGLAATQVGVVRRVFVFEHDGEDLVLANPTITRLGKELEVDDEGCLSLPGITVPVERAEKCVCEALNLKGAPVRIEAEGLLARLLQHETDHLDGVLIIDRATPDERRAAMRRYREANEEL